jgi:hypothetical protein
VEEPLSPQGVADKNGILRSFNALKIELTQGQALRILEDARAMQGKFLVTYKDVIDFLTQKRINVAVPESKSAFVDPIII